MINLILIFTMIGFLIIVFSLILFSSNESEPEFKEVCIKSHSTVMMMPQYTGSTIIMIPISQKICDEYETQRNPEFVK